MGKQQVLDFLKKNKNKKYTTAQIADALGVGRNGAYVIMNKLREQNDVKHDKVPRPTGGSPIVRYWL